MLLEVSIVEPSRGGFLSISIHVDQQGWST
jgi:hypothetical protein